jgi:GT2 family glycosyltransferase
LIGPRFHGFDGRLQISARAFPGYRHVIYHALLLDRLFSRHREFGGWKMGWFDHLSEQYVDQPMGAVLLFPRTTLDEVGLMDERFALFGNDVDYCRRIAEAGYKSLYFPQAVVEHLVGASTSIHPYRTVALSNYYLYQYLKKYARPRHYPLLWLCGMLLLLGIVPRAAGRFLGRLFSWEKK